MCSDRRSARLQLVLEASTSAGSVALIARDDAGAPWRCLGERAVAMGSGRADLLTPAVTALLAEQAVPPSRLTGVICGAGPGSFTSLRIAAALAKGLAMGIGCPLFAVPSLLLAVPAASRSSGPLLVSLDALRNECYVQPACVEPDGRVVASGPLARLPVGALAAVEEELLTVDAATGLVPRAASVLHLVALEGLTPVPIDTWEPAYGRLAEAQVQWEATHGRALPSG
jgi:tRNA threonylcarbamoyladenosine biosynthesis protein TsaB